MSKPAISISFGKSKSSNSSPQPTKPIASQRSAGRGGFSIPPSKRSRLADDSDSEDESAPKHEEVTGFDASTGGAISSKSTAQKEEVVIKNSGNADWRRRGRGKNILPDEVQAQRDEHNSRSGPVVERDEVSKESGLRFAIKNEAGHATHPTPPPNTAEQGSASDSKPSKPMSEDEFALQALLNDQRSEKISDRVIQQKIQETGARFDEVDDYRADVATRPDSCTLEEYAAMPVEEFGMALLRGMGQKRRANGETITFGSSEPPKTKENRGYLGIGAKGGPGDAETELGAWGQAAMRKNKKGEGLYTPVLMRDKRTGETLTEEELEARKKESKARKGEEDWRARRDRNLKDRGLDDYRDQTNGSSRDPAPKRERSRSRDRGKWYRDRDNLESEDKDSRERHRDRYREKDPAARHRDYERYESSSSRKSSHRERSGYGGSDRDDRERHNRDRDRHRHDDADRRRRDRY